MDIDTLLQGLNSLNDDPIARKAFFAYVLTCLLGQIGNAVWLWLGKEIDCVADRFRQDPRATVRSAIAQVGGVLGVAMAIPFDSMPFRTAIVLGILQGVAADSKLNKSSRKIWDPAERALAQQVKATTESAKP